MNAIVANAALEAIQNPSVMGRLLIVDDLEDNRAVLKRRFVRRGFEIVEAESGEAALSLLSEQNFDAILLDIMMPGMDGNETLQKIRATYPKTLLPVIMVTAKSQSEDVVTSLKLGANDYVTKPVDFNVALARVINHIGISRAEKELQQQNAAMASGLDLLELEVKERGAALVRANAAIQLEAARRAASEDRIQFLARHDTLTGLPNRFTFEELLRGRLTQCASSGETLALLFVDLDGFKNVNDTLGHAFGDELLKDVANRIRGALQADDFCARLGGDEFAIVHCSAEGAVRGGALAREVINLITGCREINGSRIFVGASVGVALKRQGDAETSSLLKQADLAMYQAKADGRGVFRFFEPEMAIRAESRRQLEIDLREAIANGDFQVVYQPFVDLKAGRVIGVEALLRWTHPVRGAVPPSEFVSLAEETGLIVQIGEWTLRHACAEVARLDNQLRVAINLSPVQFRDLNLVSVVLSALSSSGLSPDRLELEITESILLGKNTQNSRILNSLRALGVRISLDDFGTGCSGLSYLKNFQFDRIKIDRSFVQEMLGRKESRAIVRAAIGLSQDMGISTTAEGVETYEQLQGLIEEGCHVVQGFLFSTPQPSDALIDRVAEIGRRL